MLMLASLGCTADSAADGQAAVEAVQRRDYDLVLMDVQMPVMDGLEATRRIRALADRPQPLICAMSASVLDEERRACIAAGMDRHLAQPFRRAELGALLRETAETRGLVPAKQDDDCCDANTLAPPVTDPGQIGRTPWR